MLAVVELVRTQAPDGARVVVALAVVELEVQARQLQETAQSTLALVVVALAKTLAPCTQMPEAVDLAWSF
jgi:hypothetical protein